jgi:hypothetical protein
MTDIIGLPDIIIRGGKRLMMKRLLIMFLVIAISLSLNVSFASASAEEYKLIAGDGGAGDDFGFALAVSGDTVVVGAPEDDDNGDGSGSVYVFVRSGSAWTQQAKLTPVGGVAGDNFGYSVAIDGDTVVIGASSDDENGVNSGSAYVFDRSGSAWTQQAKLTSGYGADGDMFGCSVAVDGNIVVVGAYGEANSSGSIYIFEDIMGTWTLQDRICAEYADAGDNYGYSVSISEGNIMVGAPYDDDNGYDSGAVYALVQTLGGSWTQQAKITSGDGVNGDMFGCSVDVDGDTAVIGAYGDDDNGERSGSAYVFVSNSGIWQQQAKLTFSDGLAYDYFGWSVAVIEDVSVVGAPLNDENGSASGMACVFTRDGSTWSQQGKLAPADGAAGDWFGRSLGVSADAAIIGSPYDDDNGSSSGSAYAFGLSVNLPPVADAGGPYVVDEGEDILLDASASYDMNDQIVLYEWDLDNDGEYDDATGMTTTAIFSDDGVYEIGLSVTDSFGANDIDSTYVTVENAPPVVDIIPVGPVELGGTVFIEAVFSDAGTLDTHSADIYWGDNTSSPGVLTEPDDTQGTVTGDHMYGWPGIYEVVVEVTDDDGGLGTVVLTVEVLAVPEVMLDILDEIIDDMDLPEGKGDSITASLDTAAKVLEDSNPKNDGAAVNSLEAFINKLEAQRGKKIPAETADELIAIAREIIAALNAGT